jgi:type II secretion system protein D
MPGPSGPGDSPPSAPPSSPSSPSTASTGGAGQIKIWPDKTSNQLIVAAPKSKIAEIKELLAILDMEKVEDVTLRVLPLQNVNAEALVREIAPLFQKIGARAAKDRVEVTANNRSNSLIILSSEENFKAIQRLVASLDREEAQEKAMRAFPLTNADAEDVAKQLETLHEGKDSSMRYPFFFFSSSSSSQQSLKASFVADRRRNTVIVQARPSEMDSIENLIKVLDAPADGTSLAPKIFRLRYVSATDIEDVLNELFLRQQQQRNYWDPYMGFYGGSSSSAAQRDSTGGKLYGKVRITSEPYSNSIIVTSNSPEGLAAVEAMINELDSPSQAGETTLRLTLNFARATAVASSLNILFAKGGSPPLRQQPQQGQPQQQQFDPRSPQARNAALQNGFSLEQETREDAYYSWLGGQQDSPFGRTDGRATSARPVSDLVGRVRVVPDLRSNSLLITGNLHFFPQMLKLINELDAPTPQVLIEARIIEVESDFRDKLGVRWSPDRNSFTQEDMEDSLLVQSGTDYKQFFAGGKGVFDASVDINVLIQFLRKNTDAKILAEPQLSVADNELAKLFVGSQVPFLSGSLNTVEGGQNQSFDYRDVGVILEIIPHINSSDEVALKIRAESSSIRSGQTLFGAFILDTRNFKTDLIVKDKETVVLGGIIQREQSDINRKVPGLGSIPGLGWAFRKKDKVAREVELIVFLTPRITRSPAQAKELRDEIESKMPLVRDWKGEKSMPNPNKVQQ